MGSENGSQFNQVMPTIVPTSYAFRQVRSSDGSTLAMALELHTPTGVHVTFWPGDSGKDFAEQMLRVARSTAAGIEIPGLS